MKSAHELLAEVVLGAATLDDVVEWAAVVVSVQSDNTVSPLVRELLNYNPRSEQAGPIIVATLRRLVEEYRPYFSDHGEDVQRVAKRILATKCRNLLSGQIRPQEFCELVKDYDVRFLVDSKYPGWLAALSEN